MNKKAQGIVAIYGLMLGIVIVILALAFAGPVKEFADNARNTTSSDFGTGLDCENQSISNFDKATCLASDLSLPVFILILVFLGIAFLTAKFASG